jgi:hypothetical protein
MASRLRRLAVPALLLAAAAAGVPSHARAQDPVPKPEPKPAAKEAPPLDADLPPEAEIRKEASSDPRNMKPDAFPVIRNPVYGGALEVKGMDPEEWVIGTVVGKTALAFPVNVLNHHEILVDTVEGVPFLVTWCPLCRTGRVHGRTVDGDVLDFGHTGQLYRSAFLLYDTATKSSWHNATGRALVGRQRGKRLPPLASWFVKWDVWRRARPDTKVLVKDPLRPEYGADGFDHRNRLLKLKWGLGVEYGGEERLYELAELERTPLVQESVGGTPVVVVFQPKDLVATAWERTLDGKVLDLRRAEDAANGLPRLEETGEDRSVFDAVTGACVSGPLKGRNLRPLVGCFWEVYAWTAHHPKGTMFRASVPPPQELPDVPK